MDDRDLPRQRIGPYQLEARLGRGGMGEVFLAYDERLERRVAIKRIRWGPRTTAGAHERFRREARAAARLNHPAIVQVYDLVAGDGNGGEEDSGDAIIMEYVLGRPLSSLVGGPELTPALAASLAREIAEGLAHAHAAGFVHRDLKADNVMVTGAGHAKILDFGLAKPVLPTGEESLTADGAVLGTYHSMSPEQAGGGEVDERSDLFSLGSLLYEMLAGRAPFRGANPLETLKRVLTDTPPPLAVLRPDLPAPLTALVSRLLAKDREARPRSAAEVAQSLAEIASLAGLPAVANAETAAPGSGWSELPTGPAPAAALPRHPAAPVPTSGTSALRRRPRVLTALVTAVLLTLAAVGVLLRLGREPAAPLRVVVPPPSFGAESAAVSDPRLTLAASGVLEAALAGLAALEGLAPLDPKQLGGREKSPVEMARTTAADEVLLAAVAPQGELARVSLRRIAGGDGRVLWAETFEVAIDPADLRLLADAVTLHLRRAWPDHRPRSRTPALDVRDEDYAAYLAVKAETDRGGLPTEAQIRRLEAIARASPRFLPAPVTAAELALSRFISTHDATYLDRARGLAAQAAALAPGDPRLLALGFQVALAGNRGDEPEKAFARLAAALPGDPTLLGYRASLADHRGRTAEALADLRAAVARVPSWRNLARLADLERRNGRTAEARQHLRELLARAPGNTWGLGSLAQIELAYGDPARAEALYAELAALSPAERSLWTNLGLARFFSGRYAAAIDAYGKALAIDPLHNTVLLNLADCELALGRKEAAADHYRQALARLEQVEAQAGLSPDDSMAKAQCLAQLGRASEAAELAQRTLQRRPDEPGIVYAAALVYALVGDRTSARINARAALKQGIGPGWFRIAAFDSLRDDPELRPLLAVRAFP